MSSASCPLRLMILTPGTGHFYCGSCLRDAALGRALLRRGHDVAVVPLYLPRVLEEGESNEPVHMGGINMYLAQKTRLARFLPGPLARLFDRPGLLRWASRRSSMTQAPELGAMTLSMLRGERGHQAAELEKLVRWTGSQARPDVIVLSNAMLVGVARRLKEEHGVPVVMTLQGEAPFLDALHPRFADDAWAELRERATEIDAFCAVSRYYGDLMRERLRLPAERVHVVMNGLDLAGLEAEPVPLAERGPPVIGYLARLCRDKGLPTLIEAFIILKSRAVGRGLRLRVVGAMLPEDRPLVASLRRRLSAAGCADDVELRANVDREEKLDFLRGIALLSVPATYGESFGLYVLEALAAGVPVVQPRHGAFPELVEATGGGLLCEPDDPASLADAMERILVDRDLGQRLATAGRRAVLERFTADRMALDFERVCMMLARPTEA